MFNLKEDMDKLLKEHNLLIDKNDLYLVGGCVRDLLFNKIFDTNKEIRDLDFLVINHSSEEMILLGFEQVGASFPVFLEPLTKEEYALPRKEIKTGIGYKDFAFEIDNVSVLDDLSRRDITINAMCLHIATGELIDPFCGIEHLVSKEIQMVSKKSFIEDPLRTLRACRFAAIFNAQITNETKDAIKLLIDEPNQTELKSIAKERLLLEFSKVLKVNQLDNFIKQVQFVELDKVLYPFLNDKLTNLGDIYNGNIDFTLAYLKHVSDNTFNLPISSNVKELSNFLEKYKDILNNLNNADNLFKLINQSKLRHNDNSLFEFIKYLKDINVINTNVPKLEKAIESYKTIDFESIAQYNKNDYKKINEIALEMFKANNKTFEREI